MIESGLEHFFFGGWVALCLMISQLIWSLLRRYDGFPCESLYVFVVLTLGNISIYFNILIMYVALYAIVIPLTVFYLINELALSIRSVIGPVIVMLIGYAFFAGLYALFYFW